MSIIVKFSDGSRVRVRGVNSREQLSEVCERIRVSREVERIEREWDREVKEQEKETAGSVDDWFQVYREEIVRGLGSGGKGRKNEPTGKAKPKRLATDRKWRRGGSGYAWGRD